MPAETHVQAVRPILSKLAASVEQHATALTLQPVLMSEGSAVLESLGHKVEALETKFTVTERKLKETNSVLSQIKEQILLGQAAYILQTWWRTLSLLAFQQNSFKPWLLRSILTLA
ncbi:TPA: hypothetical protein ACH3X1_004399 [Trebouxia sp. C0004]